jgi:hypothetical protein
MDDRRRGCITGVAGRLRDKAWIWAEADAVDKKDEREAAAAEAEEG